MFVELVEEDCDDRLLGAYWAGKDMAKEVIVFGSVDCEGAFFEIWRFEVRVGKAEWWASGIGHYRASDSFG